MQENIDQAINKMNTKNEYSRRYTQRIKKSNKRVIQKSL